MISVMIRKPNGDRPVAGRASVLPHSLLALVNDSPSSLLPTGLNIYRRSNQPRVAAPAGRHASDKMSSAQKIASSGVAKRIELPDQSGTRGAFRVHAAVSHRPARPASLVSFVFFFIMIIIYISVIIYFIIAIIIIHS